MYWWDPSTVLVLGILLLAVVGGPFHGSSWSPCSGSSNWSHANPSPSLFSSLVVFYSSFLLLNMNKNTTRL